MCSRASSGSACRSRSASTTSISGSSTTVRDGRSSTRASGSRRRAPCGSACSPRRSTAGRSRVSSSPTSIPTTWGTRAGSPSAGAQGFGARRPSGSTRSGRGFPATRRPSSDGSRIIGATAAWVLISGDQVLPKITTNVSVWPEQPMANPLRLYLDSLDRFQPLPATTLVLPSHGLPFRGLHARLGQLRDHHAARLGEAVDALVEPRSAAQLVPILFRRELDPHQLGFALGEALAHLRFLEDAGRVVRQVGDDGVHRFLKA